MIEKRWLAAIAAVGIVVAGCGSDNNEKSSNTGTSTAKKSQPAGAPVASVKVSEVDFKLKPATVNVAKAGVVNFVATNDGKTAHSLEVEGPSGDKETNTLQPGQSGTVKVDLSKAGTYTMYCPIDGHKQLGMKGKVVVKGGSASTGQSTKKSSSGSSGGGY
jgi:uncharacterized cupredoxin-like copper-binding protein